MYIFVLQDVCAIGSSIGLRIKTSYIDKQIRNRRQKRNNIDRIWQCYHFLGEFEDYGRSFVVQVVELTNTTQYDSK